MIDVIVLGTVILMISLAVIYIRKEKRKGSGCIGCSCSSCSQKCSHTPETEKKKL